MHLIKRRDLLAGTAGISLISISGCSSDKSHTEKSENLPGPEKDTGDFDLQLRPHHILDIVTSHGQGIESEPADSGHSQHIVSAKLLPDMDLVFKLVVKSDDICTGCSHLMANGKCDDVLAQLTPSPSKQAYNDVLDCRLLDLLEIKINSIMPIREYLGIVNKQVPGIEKMCTHPKENEAERLSGLTEGLIRLGIREKA